MPISVTCACGASFRLKDEFAGKRLKCPKCAAIVQAPAVPDLVGVVEGASPVVPGGPVGTLAYQAPQIGGGVFDRDKFLLRQKVMTLNQKYTVSDEQNQPIAFVIRRTFVLRSLLAALAAIGAFLLVGGLLIVPTVLIGEQMDRGGTKEGLIAAGVIAGLVLGILAAIAAAILVAPKRHVEFYQNEAATEKLIDVLQDSKWQFIVATFTLRDAAGETIAKFRKNYLWNLIRRQWRIEAPDGTLICMAMEDSMILSLLRRFIGPMMGLLRTNFIICRGETEEVIGEFNRKFTIVDRYVLDMSADPYRTLDRRIALALGVMLDTGERR